jgi:hypothetical protein
MLAAPPVRRMLMEDLQLLLADIQGTSPCAPAKYHAEPSVALSTAHAKSRDVVGPEEPPRRSAESAAVVAPEIALGVTELEVRA